MKSTQNHRIVLAARPDGMPGSECFRSEAVAIPEAKGGELLLRTREISVDPYVRGRMNDGPSYAPPIALGEPICGEAVCEVVESRDSRFRVGQPVLAHTGWQEYAVLPSSSVRMCDTGEAPRSWALGVLGMPGLTAYVGLLDLGQPRPSDTVVVAAATGPVGATVGQIAKIRGCRVVGIAGGAEKCRHAVEVLGFDACVDHRSEKFAAELAAACSAGIDVYFENVGGHVLYAVTPLLNQGARVPVCGVIAWYNLGRLPPGPDMTPLLMRTILVRRIQVRGFIVFDHADREPDFRRDMGGWLAAGRIRYVEDVVEGLERAPEALRSVLRGSNFGKVVVRLR